MRSDHANYPLVGLCRARFPSGPVQLFPQLRRYDSPHPAAQLLRPVAGELIQKCLERTQLIRLRRHAAVENALHQHRRAGVGAGADLRELLLYCGVRFLCAPAETGVNIPCPQQPQTPAVQHSRLFQRRAPAVAPLRPKAQRQPEARQ